MKNIGATRPTTDMSTKISHPTMPEETISSKQPITSTQSEAEDDKSSNNSNYNDITFDILKS